MFRANDDANNGSPRSAPQSVAHYSGYYSNPLIEQPSGGSADAFDEDVTDGPAITPFAQNDLRLSNENTNLRLTLKTKENEYERLTDELNKAKLASNEKDHQISLLKDTVQTYQDDFSLEQKEHQKSRNRVAELEYELDLANRQLRQFQETRMENLAQQRREAFDRHREDYYKGIGTTDMAGVFEADICQTDCPDEDEGVDEVDCCGPVKTAMTRSTFLECHRCKRGFLKNMIAEYLDHIENCTS